MSLWALYTVLRVPVSEKDELTLNPTTRGRRRRPRVPRVCEGFCRFRFMFVHVSETLYSEVLQHHSGLAQYGPQESKDSVI